MHYEQPVKTTLPLESTKGDSHTARHNEYELDVYKLIHLTNELPVEVVNTEEFDANLDDLCWTDANENRVSPRTITEAYKNNDFEKVIAEHPEYAKHLYQMRGADYSHPILIFETQLLDGMHRLAKANVDGQQTIQIKRISKIPEAAIIKIHPQEDDTLQARSVSE